MKQTCSECKWWNRNKIENPVYAVCHRFPPNTVQQNGTLGHPYVASEDYCGEFKWKHSV